jgi:enterochelin esterase family protein
MRGLTLALTLALTLPAGAQKAPTVVSPEIAKDRSVIFRLWAPKASDVQLSGNWMGPRPPVPLTKGEDGVWTTTVAPLQPNIYSYGFIVDGIRTPDPSCRCTLASARRFVDSVLLIPGETPRPWEMQNNPPGTLHHERFFSARQQRMRSFVVYTPPGYEQQGSRRYPVLVLLPGTPGDENDWTSGGGFAEVVLDNLIAGRRIVPMLVVVHASDALDRAGERRSDKNLEEFEAILVGELLPLIRKRYRVSSQPESWAVAGLSLGGEFGMHVGLKHPEIFRTVASLSGSLVPDSFDQRFASLLARPDVRRGTYRLIWVGCGSEDVFLEGAKAFAERLRAGGIPHVFRQFDGPHSMAVARLQLAELLPQLFQRRPLSAPTTGVR